MTQTDNFVGRILNVLVSPFTKVRTVDAIIAPFGTMLAELQDAVTLKSDELTNLINKADTVEALRQEGIDAANIEREAQVEKINLTASSEQLDIYNELSAVERQIDQANRFIPKLERFLD